MVRVIKCYCVARWRSNFYSGPLPLQSAHTALLPSFPCRGREGWHPGVGGTAIFRRIFLGGNTNFPGWEAVFCPHPGPLPEGEGVKTFLLPPVYRPETSLTNVRGHRPNWAFPHHSCQPVGMPKLGVCTPLSGVLFPEPLCRPALNHYADLAGVIHNRVNQKWLAGGLTSITNIL